MCFGGGSSPPPPPQLPDPIPEPPRYNDQANVDVRMRETNRVRALRGTAATIKNPMGADDMSGVGTGKALLGA